MLLETAESFQTSEFQSWRKIRIQPLTEKKISNSCENYITHLTYTYIYIYNDYSHPAWQHVHLQPSLHLEPGQVASGADCGGQGVLREGASRVTWVFGILTLVSHPQQKDRNGMKWIHQV